MSDVLLRAPMGPRARAWLTLAAAAVFLVLTAVSVRAVGGLRPRFDYLSVAALLTLGLQLANAAEYRVLGIILRQRVGWREALEITTLATAANLLPVPGGALLKVREMGGRAGSFSRTAIATAFIGVLWLAIAMGVGGIGFLIIGRSIPTIAFFSVAALLLILSGFLQHSVGTASPQALGILVLIETVLCIVAALRLFLVMIGIGLHISVPVAMVFAASGPIAYVIGIVPGGLGIQELLAAALAPIVDMRPETGAIGIAADRLLGYLVLAVFAAAIWYGSSTLRTKYAAPREEEI